MSPVNNLETTAHLFGVAPNTVRAWIRQGCPVLQHADKSRGQEWKLNSADILNWRCDHAIADAVSSLQDPEGKVSKDEADRRKAVANAIVAEVDADEALKGVVSRDDADAMLADFLDVIRTGLSPASENIARRAATMADPNEIREFCESEFNRSLEAAQADLVERWARDGGEDTGED